MEKIITSFPFICGLAKQPILNLEHHRTEIIIFGISQQNFGVGWKTLIVHD